MSGDEGGAENDGDLQSDIEGHMIRLLLLYLVFSGSNVLNRLTSLLFNCFNGLDDTKTCDQSEEGKATNQDCRWESYWGKNMEMHAYLFFFK